MYRHHVQLKLEDFQGCLSIIAYIHYFKPGLLKLQSDIVIIHVEVPDNVYEAAGLEHETIQATRRWLQADETPYPGYCRAPGSAICQPVLCNCDKLTEMWNNMNGYLIADDKLKKNNTKSKASKIQN